MLAKIEWNPTQKSLRVFGITLWAIFFILGVISLFRTEHALWHTALVALAWVILGATYLLPQSLGLYFYRAWMGLAFVMGWVVGPIMMGIMFFCVITPMGVLRRSFGADTLLRNKNGVESFWRPLIHRTDAGSYRRQF
ncbi:TPA: hypothetical protein DDW35_10220 [Candidatus Sumerlaeota bacterium]|jgi:hypothetical protein|nr:hypothetical protein [Candidatus Sumerlaeota bacterium]